MKNEKNKELMYIDLQKINEIGIPNLKKWIEIMKIWNDTKIRKTYLDIVFENKQKELKENKHKFF